MLEFEEGGVWIGVSPAEIESLCTSNRGNAVKTRLLFISAKKYKSGPGRGGSVD